MPCEGCKKEKDILFEERGLFFCSLVCYALYIYISRKWTEPLIPLTEAIYPKARPTIH